MALAVSTTSRTSRASSFRKWRIGALAGLSGGAAEVAWISLYGSLSTTNAAAVARGITATFSPEIAASSLGVASGTAIHMVISIILGIAAVVVMRVLMPTHRPAYLEPLVIVGLLIGIWAVNFFVLLRLINPGFVDLIPYQVSLASKVLFGLAAGSVLFLTDNLSAKG